MNFTVKKQQQQKTGSIKKQSLYILQLTPTTNTVHLQVYLNYHFISLPELLP